MKLLINNAADDPHSINFDRQISRFVLRKGRTVYNIADIVIYDPASDREILRRFSKDVGINAVPYVFSIGTGEEIIKRRKMNLSRKEVFIFSTRSTHFLVDDYKNPVDLYIPSDYFTLLDMTIQPHTHTVEGDKESIKRISSVFSETSARLAYTYVDVDGTEKTGELLFHQYNQTYSIREWKYLDLMNWFNEREKAYEALERELDELYEKNLPTNEVIAYQKKMAAKIAERYSLDTERTVSEVSNTDEPYRDKQYELTMNHEEDFFENFLK